jgi:hypothetical protein
VLVADRRVLQRPVHGGVAAQGGERLHQLLTELVGRALLHQEDLGNPLEVDVLACRGVGHFIGRQGLGAQATEPAHLDPGRVPLDDGAEQRVVLAAQTLEVEVLILERVGQFVDERGPHVLGELRAPDGDALLDGVVEGQRSLPFELEEPFEQVRATFDEPDGAPLPDDLVDPPLFLGGQLDLAEARLVLVGRRGEEVDKDGLFEGQAAFVLHEGDQIREARIPRRGMGRRRRGSGRGLGASPHHDAGAGREDEAHGGRGDERPAGAARFVAGIGEVHQRCLGEFEPGEGGNRLGRPRTEPDLHLGGLGRARDAQHEAPPGQGDPLPRGEDAVGVVAVVEHQVPDAVVPDGPAVVSVGEHGGPVGEFTVGVVEHHVAEPVGTDAGDLADRERELVIPDPEGQRFRGCLRGRRLQYVLVDDLVSDGEGGSLMRGLFRWGAL